MADNDSNEKTSSANALQSRENAALMNEVHDIEDRIDIATMEIEDLEDYCAMMAGEIQFLRSRLDKSPDFREASDRKFKPHPENALETSAGRIALIDGSSEEKAPDILSGDSAESLPEYQPDASGVRDSAVWEATTGENVLDPFAPSEEEDKRKPKPDKGKKKKKKKNESEESGGQENAVTEEKPDQAPEPLPVTPAYRALMMEPDEAGAAEGDEPDDGQTPPEPEEGAVKTEGESSSSEEPVPEQEEKRSGAPVKAVPDKEEKKRWFKRGGQRKGKKNADRIYCPNCGSFVGEDRKCPWCGVRVK